LIFYILYALFVVLSAAWVSCVSVSIVIMLLIPTSGEWVHKLIELSFKAKQLEGLVVDHIVVGVLTHPLGAFGVNVELCDDVVDHPLHPGCPVNLELSLHFNFGPTVAPGLVRIARNELRYDPCVHLRTIVVAGESRGVVGSRASQGRAAEESEKEAKEGRSASVSHLIVKQLIIISLINNSE